MLDIKDLNEAKRLAFKHERLQQMLASVKNDAHANPKLTVRVLEPSTKSPSDTRYERSRPDLFKQAARETLHLDLDAAELAEFLDARIVAVKVKLTELGVRI